MSFDSSLTFNWRRLFWVGLGLVAGVGLTGCESASHMISSLETSDRYPLWQTITAIILATFVSEDLACIAAGMLASKSAITLIWAIVASFLGIFIGDVGLFLLGKMGGIALLRRRPIRWFVKESQIHLAEKLFQEHGGKIIFSSRLLPGSRLPIYAAAGVVGYPILKFAFFMAVAGLLSAIVLVLVSYELGEIVFGWLEIYESFALPVFIAVLLLVWLTVKLMEIFATRRSRLVFLLRSRRNYQRVLSFFNRS